MFFKSLYSKIFILFVFLLFTASSVQSSNIGRNFIIHEHDNLDSAYFFVGSTGGVGIGTRNVDPDKYKLLVSGNVGVSGDLLVSNTLYVDSILVSGDIVSEKIKFIDGKITFDVFSGENRKFIMLDEFGTFFNHDIPLDVAHGGTGLTTLTERSLLVGNGMGNVNFIAPAITNPQRSVLISDGGEWKPLILAHDDIPKLPTTKISNDEEFDLSTIPDLPAGQINDGRFHLERLPSGDDDKFLVGRGDNTNPKYRKLKEDDFSDISGVSAASKFTKGDLDENVKIYANNVNGKITVVNVSPDLPARRINSGQFRKNIIEKSFVGNPVTDDNIVNFVEIFEKQTRS